MKKISVIIPAYNAESTIKRCIVSIQEQTYKNLEIIVVNDGSKDATLGILQSLSKDDSRIKIISIPNGGVSHARNIGIDNSTGDYITFVDADDYIDEKMYERLVSIIIEYRVKIAHCSYKNVDEKGNILSVVGNKGRIVQQSHDEAMTCLISGNLFAGGLWNKLYESTLFENVRLDETIKFNEDVLANYYLFDKVESSVYVDDAYYNYVAVESSSTHMADYVSSGKQTLYVSKKMYELSEEKCYEKNALNRVANNVLILYRAYIFSNKDIKDEKKKLKQDMIAFDKLGMYKSKKDKALVLIYRYMPHIFKIMFKIYDKKRVKKLDPEQ